MAARVISVQGSEVEIAFPDDLFEPGNVPQYLSVVAGNLKKVRLQDVIFPQSIIRAHKGPRFGIEDARKILGVYDRPLVCTIVKPRAGSDPAGTPAMAEAAVRGGLDQVKDDETLTDQSFCPLIPRLEALTCILEAAWARWLARWRGTTCAATHCERNGLAMRGSSPWPRVGSIQQRFMETWMAMA